MRPDGVNLPVVLTHLKHTVGAGRKCVEGAVEAGCHRLNIGWQLQHPKFLEYSVADPLG